MAGLTSPLQHLRMFRKLCGDDALGNVVLVTTMWDRVDQATGNAREEQLKEVHWNIMLALGSRVERFKGEPDSAWAIIDAIATKKQSAILKLQEELVNLRQQLSDSQAMIIDLCDHLRKSLVQHKGTLRRLQESAASNDDEQLKKALEEEYDVLQVRLQNTFDQMTNLKLSFGRRLILLFRRKSWNVCRIYDIFSMIPHLINPPGLRGASNLICSTYLAGWRACPTAIHIWLCPGVWRRREGSITGFLGHHWHVLK